MISEGSENLDPMESYCIFPDSESNIKIDGSGLVFGNKICIKRLSKLFVISQKNQPQVRKLKRLPLLKIKKSDPDPNKMT